MIHRPGAGRALTCHAGGMSLVRAGTAPPLSPGPSPSPSDTDAEKTHTFIVNRKPACVCVRECACVVGGNFLFECAKAKVNGIMF